jgi:hypothetical protein
MRWVRADPVVIQPDTPATVELSQPLNRWALSSATPIAS